MIATPGRAGEEGPILEHPTFRQALSELGLAAVWVTPGFDLFFRFDKAAGEHFIELMTALAKESRYEEQEFRPFAVVRPILSPYHNGGPQLVQSQGRTSLDQIESPAIVRAA